MPTSSAPAAVIVVDPVHPDPAALALAGSLIAAGELVAFPTETVYGLGADAGDPVAVASVFRAKGRPFTDPLIVHVADVAGARSLVERWPDRADQLATAFWPGPLTLVLPRAPGVPDEVTAGGDSVAVRVPAHPVAEALIRAAGVPVAAPSANRFGRVSPTTAAHVLEELGDRVALVLDAGPAPLGVESTVVDLTGDRARVLRPGGIPLEDLVGELGPLDHDERLVRAETEPATAPGSFLAHYAPSTPLVLVEGDAALVAELAAMLRSRGRRCVVLEHPATNEATARGLYASLRSLDREAVDVLITAMVPAVGLGRAVNDRLFRAAHGRVVMDAAPGTVDRIELLTQG